jgi:uncharacterized membrane protein (UPF0127 family)
VGFCCVTLIFCAPAQAVCAPDRLEIQTKSAPISFSVEVADTPEEQQLGLMNRPHMASAAGMLFAFDTPKSVQFWMKDTLIPLDMLFADETGRITRIHENAIPQDLSEIDGGAGVKFVLEINGGLARRMGVNTGDQFVHPLVGNCPAT